MTTPDQQGAPEGSRCGSCGAPVRWLRNVTTGKMAPINAAPSPKGNITIDGAVYVVVPRDSPAAGPRYTNHFSDCPQAKTWHRLGKQRAD